MAVRRCPCASALSAVLLLAPGVNAADQDKIQQAIARGLAHLKNQQAKGAGTWSLVEVASEPAMRGLQNGPLIGPVKFGATSLAGVTLLECGVAGDDPALQKAANAVRQASIGLTQTYELSTAILFLDRLGDPDDAIFIQSMGVRLLGGQTASGGWSYTCPPPSRQEIIRLRTQLRKSSERARSAPNSGTGTRDRRKLPSEIQRQLDQINPLGVDARVGSDNSNTKFATLALWVARRHGIPVESALRKVETRFRNSQNPDGGWGYMARDPGAERGRGGFTLNESLGSMTCSGLLGLAAGQGVANEAASQTGSKMRDDPAIQNGLSLLGRLIGSEGPPSVPLFMPRHGDEYYFLWALERVAVAYGIQTISNKDWYAWGSAFLLAKQGRDGGWHGKYEGGVDDCFALLFLARANLTRDLTVSLSGQVKDPLARGLGGKEPPSVPDLKRVVPSPGAPSQASRSSREPRSETPTPSASRPQPSLPRDTSADEADLQRETNRLRAALVNADRAVQNQLLDQYESSKGVAYTQALAAAIPKLAGPAQSKARDVLAGRLSRMTAATLQARMTDDDPEIRRAAAIACAMKEDRAQVPELISLLEDPQPGVVRAAHAALKSLTGKDLGPPAGAGKAERSTAATRWRSWWEEQKGKE